MKGKFLSIVFFLILFTAQAQQYNPVAEKAAVVTSGKARFTILSERVIRMEYAPDSVFNDLASLTFVNRKLPVPAYEVKRDNDLLTISTAYLKLSYIENSGTFSAKNLTVAYHDAEHNFTWKPGTKDKQNLKGTTRTLDATSGKFSFLSMKKIDLGKGMLSRSGWTLVDDSQKPVFDNTDWPWVQNNATPNNLDWYFFGYGSDYKSALLDFTSVSGKISLPPKYAFGVWFSRYWKYTEQDFKDIAAGYEKSGIPLDVLVIDMDWHMTESSSPEVFNTYAPKLNGWTGFTWEKKYFPDYKGFLTWTNEKKIQTCLNLHPAAGVQPHEWMYPQFAKAMNMDTAGHPTIPFDITNKNFAKNYFDILLHPYEKAGIDFWWLDWQQSHTTKLKGVNPTFYLNYVHFSDMQRQGKRPLIFHRYGGPGNQRYQIGFSGDVVINWKSLKYQPGFTSTAANVGFGYWSHDIGGHMNIIDARIKKEPELFTRWVQWGAFSPIFRTHVTKDPDIERRMWEYPEPYFAAMKKAVQQRYALLPYIYTYSRFAYDSGISLIRPMYYQHPNEDAAYKCQQQYYFGNDMIVAPICAPMHNGNCIEQKVWLPKGQWYDYSNNKLLDGGNYITQCYALNEIPVFVKAGSIIPQQTNKMRVEGSVLDTLILAVYRGAAATFKLYEDDGATDKYRENICSVTDIVFKEDDNGMLLTITPDGKSFEGQPIERSYEVKIINCDKPLSVFVNGVVCGDKDMSYDNEQKMLLVRTKKVGISENVTVSINMVKLHIHPGLKAK